MMTRDNIQKGGEPDPAPKETPTVSAATAIPHIPKWDRYPFQIIKLTDDLQEGIRRLRYATIVAEKANDDETLRRLATINRCLSLALFELTLIGCVGALKGISRIQETNVDEINDEISTALRPEASRPPTETESAWQEFLRGPTQD